MTEKFPFLPINLLEETLKIYEPLLEYTHLPPLPSIPTIQPQEIHTTNHNTRLITWNASSLNTALPNLFELIANTLDGYHHNTRN
jgi:hypothetical protein